MAFTFLTRIQVNEHRSLFWQPLLPLPLLGALQQPFRVGHNQQRDVLILCHSNIDVFLLKHIATALLQAKSNQPYARTSEHIVTSGKSNLPAGK